MSLKKNIRVIDKFPSVFFQINIGSRRDKSNFILDASDYPRPLELLALTNPDTLLLNLKVKSEAAIDMVTADIPDYAEMKIGMITRNRGVYYTSLCSTLDEEYFPDRSKDIHVMPLELYQQQLN